MNATRGEPRRRDRPCCHGRPRRPPDSRPGRRAGRRRSAPAVAGVAALGQRALRALEVHRGQASRPRCASPPGSARCASAPVASRRRVSVGSVAGGGELRARTPPRSSAATAWDGGPAVSWPCPARPAWWGREAGSRKRRRRTSGRRRPQDAQPVHDVVGQLRQARVRFLTLPPSRKDSRRSTAGGEFRLGTRSIYMTMIVTTIMCYVNGIALLLHGYIYPIRELVSSPVPTTGYGQESRFGPELERGTTNPDVASGSDQDTGRLPVEYLSNQPFTVVTLAIPWEGRPQMPCASPGTLTSTASTPRSLSAL